MTISDKLKKMAEIINKEAREEQKRIKDILIKKGYLIYENVEIENYLIKTIIIKEGEKILIEYDEMYFECDDDAIDVMFSGYIPSLVPYRKQKKEVCTTRGYEMGECKIINHNIFLDIKNNLDFFTGENSPKNNNFPAIDDDRIKNFVYNIEFSKSKIKKVQGASGTGKTIDICYIALDYIKKHPSEKVLIVTYNITLRNKIRFWLQQTDLKYSNKQIVVTHYHEIFKTKYSQTRDEKFYYKIDDNWLCDSRQKQGFKDLWYKKFNLILVDETQDYYMSMLENLKFIAKGCVGYFGDVSQDLYGYNPKGDQTESGETAISAPGSGRWMTLSKQYRHGGYIFDFSQKYKSFILKINEGNIENYVNDDQQYYIYEHKKSYEDVKEYIIYILNKIGEDKNNTVILASNKKILRSLYNDLCDAKIIEKTKIQTAFDPDANMLDINDDKSFKIAFDSYSSKLKMSTIKSFKGLEQNTVILIIENNDVDDIKFLSEIYTGITRATKKLYIINTNDCLHYLMEKEKMVFGK